MTSVRLFFASSSEGRDELLILKRRVQRYLDLKLEKTPLEKAQYDLWPFDTFGPGRTYLEQLQEQAASTDFAVFLCRPDRSVFDRKSKVYGPRENVIFEAGLFTGQLGPDKVFMVRCNGPDARKVDLPSDLDGLHHFTYVEPVGEKSFDACAHDIANEIMKRRVSAPIAPPTVEPEPTPAEVRWVRYPGTNSVVIFRDCRANDWFDELEALLQGKDKPTLDARMLYYGPGLHRNWFALNRNFDAHQQVNKAFEHHLAPLLDHVPDKKVKLVDLGVGDFVKGKRILEYYTDPRKKMSAVSYYPLDISYEMLASAVNPRSGANTAIINGLLKLGTLVGLNTSFAQLKKYKYLFGTEGTGLFLLLGNTLGNEAAEQQTLNGISQAMIPGDHLLLELQMAEEEPLSAEEVTLRQQRNKYFYGGAFTALGCDSDALDLDVRLTDEDDALTYDFYVRFRESAVLRHPALEDGRIEIFKGREVKVYTIRKYRQKRIDRLLATCGFETIACETSRSTGTRDRRFSYVLARRTR